MALNSLAMVGDQQVETAQTLQQRVAAVHNAYANVMQRGVHYGVIPGTGNKPTLLKPGAEMLCTQFRLVPTYDVRRDDLPDGQREYGVTCTLTKLDTGQVWAQGIGLCTTLESKYRYRWQGKGQGRRRVPNPDIADTYNTVLKMAKKRALVDATLTATGCSDMFTQDVEDFAQPQQVDAHIEPTVDLNPIRGLFKEYKAALGIDSKAANARLCEAEGVGRMADLTQQQADDLLARMRVEIEEARKPAQPQQQEPESEPEYEQPEPEEAKAEPEAAQAQQYEAVGEEALYDADVEF